LNKISDFINLCDKIVNGKVFGMTTDGERMEKKWLRAHYTIKCIDVGKIPTLKILN